MTSGKVKWFSADRGYGFLSQDDGGPDVFVHMRAVRDAGLDGLRQGQSLEFRVERDAKSGKLRAVGLVDPAWR